MFLDENRSMLRERIGQDEQDVQDKEAMTRREAPHV